MNEQSLDDECKKWLEKQPNYKEKVELGKLLMIPLSELSPTQLARYHELSEYLRKNFKK